MKIYLSIVGTEKETQEIFEYSQKHKIRINELISYKYDLTTEQSIDYVLKTMKGNLLYDSGAFTLWKLEGTVDIEKYKERILELTEVFNNRFIAINLDVIPGRFGKKPTKENIIQSCEDSYKNYLELEKTGVKIMPVFHQHDEFEWLEKYIDTDCELLGISPANDIQNKGRKRWLDTVFSIVRDKKKCHGLAVTSSYLMKEHPWYSVDSASWKISAGFGNVSHYENGSITTAHQIRDREKIIERGLINCVDILNGDKRLERRHQNIDTYLQFENYATKLWERRGVVWD